MVFRNPSLYVAMLALVATSVNLVCAQDVEAKGKKRSGARSYFVPPPPAYTPSLTPAVYVNGQPQVAEAKSKKKKKEVVFLVCEETGDHNYTLRRKTGGEKLKLSKFCPRLRKHTVHVEKKK